MYFCSIDEPVVEHKIKELSRTIHELENKKNVDLPERYIINEHVCVLHWKDGSVTKSFKHEQDIFNKKIGFLLAWFRHYHKDYSRNKIKRIISWIKYEHLEDYLFDLFVEETEMTVKQADAYIRDLKMEGK